MLLARIVVGGTLALAASSSSLLHAQGGARLVGDTGPCSGVTPDSFEPNDSCYAPVSIGRGAHLGLNVSEGNWDYYTIPVPVGFRVTIEEQLDLLERVSYVLTSSNCGPYLTSGMDGLTWVNETGEAISVTLEVRRLAHSQVACSEYSMWVEVEPDPCFVAADDVMEPNDDCQGALWVEDGTYPGLFVSRFDRDHYRFFVQAGETFSASVLFNSTEGDLDAFLRPTHVPTCGTGFGGDVLAQGVSGTHHEFLNWTNDTGSAMDVVLEINVWEMSGQACNEYDLVISGTDAHGDVEVGTPFCAPMDANSSGESTRLRARFGTSTGSDLHLTATDGPPYQFRVHVGWHRLPGSGFCDWIGSACVWRLRLRPSWVATTHSVGAGILWAASTRLEF